MVLRSDRKQTEATQDGLLGVLAEHSTDGRGEADASRRSGSWGTDAQGTQCREGEAGHHALIGGHTSGTLSLDQVYTKLDQIAEQASRDPKMTFTSLAHLLTPGVLLHAFRLLRQDAACGIDGMTWEMYQANLYDNIHHLWRRLREKQYRASPVMRCWIGKEDGSQRPLGIPTLEDKIVQRAVVTIMEPIYEPIFYDFSYAYRPGRSAHDALQELREHCMNGRFRWIADIDVSGFFDSVEHGRLQELLRLRVNDGGLRQLIGKWLKAGVMEQDEIRYPNQGTPQGSVISPLLSNIYLHYVLDEWLMEEIRPQLKGEVLLIRFADDFVVGCEDESDAHFVMEQIRERFASFGLTIHPEKSRLIDFGRPSLRNGQHGRTTPDGSSPSAAEPKKGAGTFDFLGFTHYWARSRRGFWVIKRRTMAKRQRRAFRSIWEWCRRNRHLSVQEQHYRLSAKLRGHYNYYGIRCNLDRMRAVCRHANRAWRYWLSRRSHRSAIPWEKFARYQEKYPLPQPRIVHHI